MTWNRLPSSYDTVAGGEIELDEFQDASVPLAERRPPYPSEHPTDRLHVTAERRGATARG
ncbi:MAG TPA: hypothetical protein VIJ47_12215 [Acidimicrobiales bacterium]